MTLAESDVDIAAIVGDMPAKACECPSESCQCGGDCDHQAKWIARGHLADNFQCWQVQIYLCDPCLQRARLIASEWAGGTCRTCGLVTKTADDIVGPVIAL
ncbi:MAG: hypothetical protein ACRDTI_20670 [Mycobacterium sp.]